MPGEEPTIDEAQAWVEGLLSREPARAMAGHGFVQHGLAFVRSGNLTSQRIQFHVTRMPRETPDLRYQLSGNATVRAPAVEPVYVAMAAPEDVDVVGTPYMIEGFESLSNHPDEAPWHFGSKNSVPRLGQGIAEFLVRRVVPYCDSVMTLEGVLSRSSTTINGVLDQLERLGRPRDIVGARGVFAAAVAKVLGHHDEALELLHLSYPEGRPSRERYATAFALATAAPEGHKGADI